MRVMEETIEPLIDLSQPAPADEKAPLPFFSKGISFGNIEVDGLNVEEWITRLEHADPGMRAQAVMDLTRLHANAGAAVEGLIARVRDPEEDGGVRNNAMQALGRIGDPAAIPVLIEVLRETTSGFGKASISTVTQRAYIQDFELSSGGTGNVVAEVADPVIGTFSEGTTLEMKVILWERESVVRVLRKLSGQRFGADPGEWQRWWKQQPGN